VSVALVTQHAKLSPVVCLYDAFPHYLINDTIFGVGEGLLKNKTYGLIFSTIFARNIIINIHMALCTVPVTRVKSYLNLRFLDRFSKYSQIANFMKIVPGGAELFHANGNTGKRTDRQPDRKKLIVAFHNFAKTPKN
jgi:hypothetical protein